MLDSVYPIVWMDAIHYKVTDERGCVVTRAIYNVQALTEKDIRSSSECIYPGMRKLTSGSVF